MPNATTEEQTAYDMDEPSYRVRIRNNGYHVAVMVFDTMLDRFIRVNITPDDFARIVAAASPEGNKE